MTDLLNNAVDSIQLGIEDYKSNDPRRPISAVRNFYAGVLLLGKQCLLDAAPEADPMEVLASKFLPVLNGDGGVVYEPKGNQTIDLFELKERLRAFGLPWPDGDIDKLQKLRNAFEHFHSPAPQSAIQQAIVACFPLVVGFCRNLKTDPAKLLGATWEVMLAEKEFFQQQKLECDGSLKKVQWLHALPGVVEFGCPKCASELLYQLDRENSTPASIEGRCLSCGESLSAEIFVELVVDAAYGTSWHDIAQGGEESIFACPECFNDTYVEADVAGCFFCEYVISGECAMCTETLGVRNMSVNDSSLCDYCYYKMSKDD